MQVFRGLKTRSANDRLCQADEKREPVDDRRGMVAVRWHTKDGGKEVEEMSQIRDGR
jgi:hypothetical protein